MEIVVKQLRPDHVAPYARKFSHNDKHYQGERIAPNASVGSLIQYRGEGVYFFSSQHEYYYRISTTKMVRAMVNAGHTAYLIMERAG